MADTIATAADYADAMMTARTAKNWLFLLLLIVLLTQLTVFFLARYSDVIFPQAPATDAEFVTATPTTGEVDRAAVEAADPATLPAVEPREDAVTSIVPSSSSGNRFAADFSRYVIGATDFVGTVLSVVFAIVLLLLVNIMLIGRLIGVSRLTSAFIWSVVLAVLLFPWQAFLDPYTFKIPGVLYTWDELVRSGRFTGELSPEGVLKWARFVAFPVVAVIILMLVQVKSSRGLKQALGEATPDTESIPVT